MPRWVGKRTTTKLIGESHRAGNDSHGGEEDSHGGEKALTKKRRYFYINSFFSFVMGSNFLLGRDFVGR